MEQHRQLSVTNRRTGVTPASLATVLTKPPMVAVLCLIAAARVWSICAELPARATRWDFSIYYMSAMAVRHRLNPYQIDFRPLGKSLGLEAGVIRHATDPPTFLLLMEPLAAMPERTGFYTWIGLNAIALAAALSLLLGKSSPLDRSTRLVLAALALMYPPIYYHFFFGQSKIPILLALVLMMRSMERGWDRAAGLCLAFASLLRLFPLLLIGYLAIQRRWAVLLWTFTGLWIGGFVTLGLLGTGDSLSFLRGAEFMTGQRFLVLPWNMALAATVSHLFWFIGGQELSSTIDLVRRLTITVADATLLGATIWTTVGLGTRNDPDWRALSMWVVASVLLSPTAWVHYMVLFLIPFVQISTAAIRLRGSVRVQWMIIVSYCMTYITMVPPLLQTSVNRGVQWPGWLISVLSQTLFIAAMFMYLASYDFTVEATHLAWTNGRGKGDSAGLAATE